MKSNVYIPNVGFRQAGVRLEAMELTLRRDGAGARAVARALPPLALPKARAPTARSWVRRKQPPSCSA